MQILTSNSSNKHSGMGTKFQDKITMYVPRGMYIQNIFCTTAGIDFELFITTLKISSLIVVVFFITSLPDFKSTLSTASLS